MNGGLLFFSCLYGEMKRKQGRETDGIALSRERMLMKTPKY